MRVPARPLTRTAVAAALAAAAFGGCGGDDGGSSGPSNASPAEPAGTRASADVLRKAAAATFRVEGAEVFVDQRVTVDGNALTFKGEGIATERLRRSRVTLDADLSRLPGAERDFGPGGSFEQDVRRDGSTLYVTSDPLAKALPKSRPWLRIAPSDLAKKAVIDLSAVSSATLGQDPAQVVRFLRTAVTDVRELGSETVRGASTTHYKATFDLQRAVRDAPPDARPALRQTIKATGTRTVPIEVWVDADGRVRRLKQTFGATFGGQPVKGSGTVELSGFGPQEPVRLPSDRRVIGLVDAFPYAFDRSDP